MYKPDEKIFVLVMHVPLVAPQNLMQLYEFIPLPVHFNFAANISITPDVGQTNLLAIGHSHSFQAISSTDLHACLNQARSSIFPENHGHAPSEVSLCSGGLGGGALGFSLLSSSCCSLESLPPFCEAPGGRNSLNY